MEDPVRFDVLVRRQKAQGHPFRFTPNSIHSREPGYRLAGHPVEARDLQPTPVLANPGREHGQAVDLPARERELLAVGEQLADHGFGALCACALGRSLGLGLRPDGQEDYEGRQRGPEHMGVHVNVPPWDGSLPDARSCRDGIRRPRPSVAGTASTAAVGRARALSRSAGRSRDQVRGG
jgi:hypothetical protein